MTALCSIDETSTWSPGRRNALEQNIEALGDVFREADAFAVRRAEEGGEALARGEDEILRRVGRAVAAAVRR